MRKIQTIIAAAALLSNPGAPAAAQTGPVGTPLPARPLGVQIDDGRGPEAFLRHQLTFERVAEARAATEADLRAAFETAGVPYPPAGIYLRVLKHERLLELWARSHDDPVFRLVREYPVCAPSGELGPKARLGDFQVPEGFYFIDEFNPRSNYHLSLRISYPNMADRLRRQALALGGDIFVHGGCQTVGCVPIENDKIREVYWLAVQAMDAGQRVIPVHIFPARMDSASLTWLEGTFEPGPGLRDFWRNLAEGYGYFEATRQVPWVTVAADGRYQVPDLGNTPVLAAEPPRPLDEAAVAAPDTDDALGEPVEAAPLDPASARAGQVQPDSATGERAAPVPADSAAGERAAPIPAGSAAGAPGAPAEGQVAAPAGPVSPAPAAAPVAPPVPLPDSTGGPIGVLLPPDSVPPDTTGTVPDTTGGPGGRT